MNQSAFDSIRSACAQEQELEDSIQYLAKCLSPIVKQSEATLICFPGDKKTDFGSIAAEAIRRCGGRPVFWNEDLRWKELLRLAFLTKASTIIGPPVVVLGLAKLVIHDSLPTCFYNAVLVGYPCMDWMIEGIEKGLDCKTWGIFAPGTDCIIAGFSCQSGRGVHIRDDKFGVEIVDDSGNPVSGEQSGRIVLYQKARPEVRWRMETIGALRHTSCPCGNPSAKLVNLETVGNFTSVMREIAEDIQSWNSILECRVEQTESGLELEVICFKGEKLPKLPTCAKLILRSWDPETDVPMALNPSWLKH